MRSFSTAWIHMQISRWMACIWASLIIPSCGGKRCCLIIFFAQETTPITLLLVLQMHRVLGKQLQPRTRFAHLVFGCTTYPHTKSFGHAHIQALTETLLSASCLIFVDCQYCCCHHCRCRCSNCCWCCFCTSMHTQVPLREFRANRYSYSGRPFVRKSQTHFGWNWGPGFITQGECSIQEGMLFEDFGFLACVVCATNTKALFSIPLRRLLSMLN